MRLTTTVLVLGLVGLSCTAVTAKELDFSDVGVYATDFDFCTFTDYKIGPSDTGYEAWAKRLREAHEQGKFNLVSLQCFDRVSHSRPVEEYCQAASDILAGLDLETVDAIRLSEENVTWNNGLEVLNRLYDHVKSIYDGPVYQWMTFPDVPHPKLRADGWVYDAYGPRYLDFRRYVMKYLVTGKPVIMCVNASPDVNDLTVSTEQVLVCREFNLPVMYFAVDWDHGSPGGWLGYDKQELGVWRDRVWSLVEMANSADTSELPTASAQYSPGSGDEIAGDGAGDIAWETTFGSLAFFDVPTIDGFLRLRWDGQEETLAIVAPGEATLTYHLFSFLPIEAPMATAECELTDGGACEIELSADGRSYVPAEELTDFAGRHLWLRVRLSSAREDDAPAAVLRRIALTARSQPPAERIIRLRPGGSVDRLEKRFIRYADDFRAARHELLGLVAGPGTLEASPGELRMRGAQGRGNRVTVRERFVCDQPMEEILVRLSSLAYERDHGAHNELSLSLDGENILTSTSTAGKAGANGRFDGWLEIDATEDKRFEGVTSFWVHMTMVNGSGVEANPSNFLRRLEIAARTVEPAP